MKKIGILYGQERSFPEAFIKRINEKNIDGIVAEAVTIDKVMQAEPTEYAVIIDRISQDVPFYRAYLKNAALCGTAVINNPFWWSADEKFFNNALAVKLGVPVPNTVLLPSKDHPEDTTAASFSNLAFPLDWDNIFEYVGFPAFMKPFAGGGWKHVYKLEDAEDFFSKYNETGQLVMMLQEAIDFTAYFRCYCIGRKHVRVMHYEPRNPHHLRYDAHFNIPDELMKQIESFVLKLNEGLGYDFNTVEFAIRDGVPYAIDFCNPAPDADINSVGQENFDWVVETAASYAIERAQAQKPGQDNLSWGTFMSDAIKQSVGSQVKAAPQKKAVKKAPAKKAAPAKSADPKSALFSKIGEAKAADKDDLKKLKGVGPKLEKMLNEMGIYTFGQVSKMGKKEYELVDSMLTSFKGRGQRDDWAGQAKKLMK
ncbi:MAG: hypothetical protein MRY78_19950 [Saprospiraceae bacterium]|nr:hypothetical protein [Saprospiraceae bacterium]